MADEKEAVLNCLKCSLRLKFFIFFPLLQSDSTTVLLGRSLMFFTLTFSDKQIKTASKSHFDKISDRKSNTLVAEPVEETENHRHTLNWSLSLSRRANRNNKNYSNILI